MSKTVRPRGWLASQLPPAMITPASVGEADPFLPRYLSIFEDVAGTVQDRVDSLAHLLDPTVAPLPMVRWLGSWMGLNVPDSMDPELQRKLVRATGHWLSLRGTPRGLGGLVAELTSGEVRVIDEGGVFSPSEELRFGTTVTVEVETTGKLTDSQLRSIISSGLPVGTKLELSVGLTRR